MTLLLIGLLLFLGAHGVHLFAPGWRAAMLARHGELRWKGGYALLSLLGLVLIVVGYGEARLAPEVAWVPPAWTRHLAALLLLPSFVLLVAADLPGSRIRQRVGHPMVAGVALWALAHLLANGTVADLLLFGSFLAWSLASLVLSRRRDARLGTTHPPGRASRDAATVVVAVVLWMGFAFWLHGLLFGVRPFG